MIDALGGSRQWASGCRWARNASLGAAKRKLPRSCCKVARMSILVDPIVEFVRDHSAWVAPIVFVLAFCESFAFVSLLVPATVILFAIGGLIGLSGIEFWAVWSAAAIGAAVGDWLAYDLAMRFQRRIVDIWPLS